jgi:hypothetical protein
MTRPSGYFWLVPIILAVACTPSPATTEIPSASPVADGETCPDIDLRDPNGDPLDLNGTWLGTDWGEHVISHHGSCVTWTGHSLDPQPDPATGAWTFVFTGNTRPDFTIDGEADYLFPAAVPPQQHMHQVVDIDFFEAAGSTLPTLYVRPEDAIAIPHWRMAPSDTVSDRVELVGTYEGDQCLWLNVDGQRHEMWVQLAANEDISLITPDGHVVARPGDHVSVVAQISPGWASPHECGPGQTLLVWEIAQAP